MVLVTAYKPSLQDVNSNDLRAIDSMWRLLIGLGCIPGVLALYFRLTIPESPRYTADIERNVQRAAQEVDAYLNDPSIVIDPDFVYPRVDAPRASREDFLTYFGTWQNLKVLLGTCSAWFCQDVSILCAMNYTLILLMFQIYRLPSTDLVSTRQVYLKQSATAAP